MSSRRPQSIAKAGIAQAQAALDAAKLDLSYTRSWPRWPGGSGCPSTASATWSGPSSGTLATIVSRDPIDVQFPVTQRELLEARRDIEARGRGPVQGGGAGAAVRRFASTSKGQAQFHRRDHRSRAPIP